MSRALQGTSALLALALVTACSQTSGGSSEGQPANGSATVAKEYEGPKPEGVSSPNDAVTTTFYIPQSAISDMYEIQAGELAQVRARAPEVKAFARMMVADHKKSSEQLQQFVANHPVNIAIPQNIDPRRTAMLKNLQDAGADEFDAVYVGQQAAAHQEAFNLQSSYASRGDNPALKSMAQGLVKVIAHHRQMAAHLDAKFGPKAKGTGTGQEQADNGRRREGTWINVRARPENSILSTSRSTRPRQNVSFIQSVAGRRRTEYCPGYLELQPSI